MERKELNSTEGAELSLPSFLRYHRDLDPSTSIIPYSQQQYLYQRIATLAEKLEDFETLQVV
jgi:hypothetical protein